MNQRGRESELRGRRLDLLKGAAHHHHDGDHDHDHDHDAQYGDHDHDHDNYGDACPVER